ncbi:MAG TPA: TonB-dependent receptor [Bryobacteraceae bacterium]|nr:TonB-dependent receptor [Bryobacteraceae bacterium]
MVRLVAFWYFVLFTSTLLAQAPTGLIAGRVVDSSNAVVPGVSVKAINLATNVVAVANTNREGDYAVQSLIPGTYRLEVEATGFRRYERSPIEVRVGDRIDVPVKLELGAVADSVTVTAETPLLESTSANLGQVVDNRRVLDLPSPGSSVLYQAQTTLGVVGTASPTNLYGPNVLGAPKDIVVAGSRNSQSEFAIDGNPIMSRSGGYAINPPPEMIQEFRVQTAAYDASLGRFTGAHVNMVMKSGSNTPHGSLVYNNLPKPLIARDFFTNRYIYDLRTGPITEEKIDNAWPPQRIMRVRGNIGAPVLLPKVYDGRNRTFWTYGFDVMRRKTALQNSYTVPSLAQRDGDLSQLLALGSRYQIYDPDTITQLPNGRTSRLPLAGNIVPASRIDPFAKALMQYYPAPNSPGTIDGAANYTTPNPAANRIQVHMGRVDHAISDSHRLFSSFTTHDQQDTSEAFFHNVARGSLMDRRTRGVSLDDTMVLSPSLMLNLRYGLTYMYERWYSPNHGFDLSSLGLPSSLAGGADPSLVTMPRVTIAGVTQLGNNAGSEWATTFHSFNGGATYMRGAHSIRFGAEARIFLHNGYNFGDVSPSYDFSTNWTRGPLDNSPAAPTGQGVASFLFGLPTGGGIDQNASFAQRSNYYAVYIQDDWKATSRLTLNLGLRYDVDTPTVERYDRSILDFDFTTPASFEAQARAKYAASPLPQLPASQFSAAGGILFAGVNGRPRGLWDTDRNNISPRIGLAYKLTPTTVIRSGYAIYFEPRGADRVSANQLGFSIRTALTPSHDNGVTFRAGIKNPFPDGILTPVGSAGGLATAYGRGVTFFNLDQRTAYVQRWSFSIQRELPYRMLAEIGYVGSKSVGLPVGRAFNPIPREYYSTSPERDQGAIDFHTKTVPNPFYGLPEFAGTGFTGTTLSQPQLLRPMPHLSGITANTNEGYSWYHGLQARLEKRFSQGYTFQANYTFSKNMEAVSRLNETDPYLHRVISAADRPHVFNFTSVFELPFGRGRRWLSHNRITDYIVGGWSLQAIFQAQTGAPLEFGNVLFRGNIEDIALPASERTPDRWFNTEAGFEKSTARQLSYNLRTFPLRFNGIRGDGIANWNLSAIKVIRLLEGLGLELRAEAVDATNTPIFTAPNMSPTSSQFGQITSIGGQGVTQRRINLGAKLSW